MTTKNFKTLRIKDLASRVFDLAQSNKQGFTVSIKTLEPIKTGFVVSYKDTQNSFNENDLQYVVSHALNYGGVIGGWYNTEDGKYYFDSNKVFDNKKDAINFAIENEQIAIFNLDTMQEIRL